MTYPITDIEGIGPALADRLKGLRIRTTSRLLEAAKNPRGRKTLAEQTGIADYRVLYSTTEYKKIRLPYFIPEYDNWEALCSAVAAEGTAVSAVGEVLA